MLRLTLTKRGEVANRILWTSRLEDSRQPLTNVRGSERQRLVAAAVSSTTVAAASVRSTLETAVTAATVGGIAAMRIMG